jgi:hypothetical protein
MTSLGSIRWILLALLGLAVAAGVSVAASQLVSQRIGLAAEPPSAGKDLAPPKHDAGQGGGDAGRQTPTNRTTDPVTTTTTTTTTLSTAPSSSTPTTTTPVQPPPSTSSPTGSQGGGTQGEPPDD